MKSPVSAGAPRSFISSYQRPAGRVPCDTEIHVDHPVGHVTVARHVGHVTGGFLEPPRRAALVKLVTLSPRPGPVFCWWWRWVLLYMYWCQQQISI